MTREKRRNLILQNSSKKTDSLMFLINRFKAMMAMLICALKKILYLYLYTRLGSFLTLPLLKRATAILFYKCCVATVQSFFPYYFVTFINPFEFVI